MNLKDYAFYSLIVKSLLIVGLAIALPLLGVDNEKVRKLLGALIAYTAVFTGFFILLENYKK